MTRLTSWSRPVTPEFDHESWTRRNSALTPEQCEAMGLCVACGGRGGLWWSFGDQYGYMPCRHCQPQRL